jgi:hypothetical protein
VTETVKTYGSLTDTWGTTWASADTVNGKLALRITCGTVTIFQQDYQTFGFTIPALQTVTGLEVGVEAKYTGGTTSIDHIKIRLKYGTSPLPVEAGSMTYVTDTKKLTFYDGTSWVTALDNSGTITADTINEKTAAAGVTVDGVLLKDSQVTTDVINEKTAAAGVTVDGLLIKDGMISHPYKARATRSGTQASIADATVTKVQLNNESFDTNNNFDSTTNYEYTVPVTGYYQVNAGMRIVASAIVSTGIYIYKDGASDLSFYQANNSVGEIVRNISGTIYLIAGQKIDLRVYVDCTGTASVLGGADLSIHLLSI